MFLYHGSNIPVQVPQIRSRGRALDFGQAFYLTTSFEQAGVFDIWENEQVTGSPLRSGYLKAV